MSEASRLPIKVLVLEDEGLIALVIEGALAEAGYEPTTARTAHQALTLLDQQPFDAAVLDVGLSDGNSFDVAEVLTMRKVPFIFCTASSVPMAAPYLDVPVIDKPFRETVLLDAIGQVLGPR